MVSVIGEEADIFEDLLALMLDQVVEKVDDDRTLSEGWQKVG